MSSLVFVSHLHHYNRTCPLVRGVCQTNGSGVVYQRLGPLGANNFRSVNVATASVSGVDASGTPRTDNGACSGPDNIYVVSKTDVNDFCRVHVDGPRVIGDCYVMGSSNTAFDSWEVDACG